MGKMPFASAVRTRADAGEVRANAGLAEEDMFVVNEIAEDGIALAPAAFDVGAVSLRADLHGVAACAAVRAINFLAELGGAGAAGGEAFAGEHGGWLELADLFEILHDEAVPRPEHGDQQAE